MFLLSFPHLMHVLIAFWSNSGNLQMLDWCVDLFVLSVNALIFYLLRINTCSCRMNMVERSFSIARIIKWFRPIGMEHVDFRVSSLYLDGAPISDRFQSLRLYCSKDFDNRSNHENVLAVFSNWGSWRVMASNAWNHRLRSMRCSSVAIRRNCVSLSTSIIHKASWHAAVGLIFILISFLCCVFLLA